MYTSKYSFPDLVMLGALHHPNQAQKNLLRPFARRIPHVKRISIDDKAVNAANGTRDLEAEEIIGHLMGDHLPFDALWIDGPIVSYNRPVHPDERFGAIIEKTSTGFNANVVYITSTYRLSQTNIHPNVLGLSHKDHVISGSGTTISVCNERGIIFEEEKLIESISYVENILSKERDKNYQGAIQIIEESYRDADFLSRLFILLGSPTLKGSVDFQRTKSEIESDRKILTRANMGASPKAGTSPIPIDLSKLGRQVLAKGTEKEKRLLLGWTDVRRSREIISKYNVRFRRKPHDRKIPADEDRRNSWRAVTSSDPDLRLELGENGLSRRLGGSELT